MVDDTLDGAKSTRYKHAARHLMECQSLASAIEDCSAFETDEAFIGRLRAKHGRKTGFWSQFAKSPEQNYDRRFAFRGVHNGCDSVV